MGNGNLAAVIVADDGVIYGVTDTIEEMTLLYVPGSVEKLDMRKDLPYDLPVTWVYEYALVNMHEDLTIWLTDETLFPMELYQFGDGATWMANDGSFADNWKFSCAAAQRINFLRGEDAPQIEPDADLIRSAMVRAPELEESFDSKRPDGSSWGDLLNEQEIPWDYSFAKYYRTDDDSITKRHDITEKLRDEYAAADPDSDNQYYTHIGLAFYWGADDKMYCAAIAVTR